MKKNFETIKNIFWVFFLIFLLLILSDQYIGRGFDWMALITSMIGALVTIFGVKLSLDGTRKNNYEERKEQVKPYLQIVGVEKIGEKRDNLHFENGVSFVYYSTQVTPFFDNLSGLDSKSTMYCSSDGSKKLTINEILSDYTYKLKYAFVNLKIANYGNGNAVNVMMSLNKQLYDNRATAFPKNLITDFTLCILFGEREEQKEFNESIGFDIFYRDVENKGMYSQEGSLRFYAKVGEPIKCDVGSRLSDPICEK